MKPGRIAAVDHGTKRSALAVSDTRRCFAFPSGVFYSEKELIEGIGKLMEEAPLGGVVVGLPLNMDGSAGERARDVLSFCERLRRALGVEVVTVDERLTSFQAESLLRGAKKRGAEGREQIDAVSAQLILENYLAQRGGSR